MYFFTTIIVYYLKKKNHHIKKTTISNFNFKCKVLTFPSIHELFNEGFKNRNEMNLTFDRKSRRETVKKLTRLQITSFSMKLILSYTTKLKKKKSQKNISNITYST